MRGSAKGLLIASALGVCMALPAPASAVPTLLETVGSTGTGAGQLNGSSGVAFDSSSNLYVTEQNNHRVSAFSPSGTFLYAFGWGVDTGASEFQFCTTTSMCQTGLMGGGAGQLNSPRLVTVDGAGLIYVADFANHRISVFNSAGPSFVNAFGFGVKTGTMNYEVCDTACLPGISGEAAGQMSNPRGVAVDGAGNLYVADSSNDRIDVFNTATSTFTRAFGQGVDNGTADFESCTSMSGCQGGFNGGDAGALSSPFGVALDGSGALYVSEGALNSRISVVNPAVPSFTRAFGWGVDAGGMGFEVCTTASECQAGLQGAMAGQLDLPFGLAADGSGNLYVAEFNNDRVSVFNTAVPSFVHAFGRGVDTGAAAFQVCTAMSFCQTGMGGEINTPLGVAVDCRGAVWAAGISNVVRRVGEPGTPLPPCPATPPTNPPSSTPISTPITAPSTPAPRKKCKKKKRRGAAAAKKCRKKRR